MRHSEPLPTLVSIASLPERVVDRQALRAALRLVLTPGQADDVVRKLPDESGQEDLGRIARDAIDRARLDRLLARLQWRRREPDGRMLGPASGVRAECAIALAMTVGSGLSGRELADALDARIERAGERLVEGRRTLDAVMREPCRKTAWLVGRYDDQSLDPDERVELMTHLNHCPTCQEVVERSRVVDAAIAEEVRRHQATMALEQADRPVWIARLRRGALATSAILVAVITVIVGSAVSGRLTGTDDEPVPLVAPRAPAAYTGWLVVARADGSVRARNLQTGAVRGIIGADEPVIGISQEVTLSPDGTRLMRFVGEFSQSSRSRVIVTGLDGVEIGRVEWASENTIVRPTGWIDEQHILVWAFPVYQPGQTPDAFVEQYSNESRVIVVNVETGDQRELVRGNVGYAWPSPDGRFVAVQRLVDERTILTGQGEVEIEMWPVSETGVAEPLTTIDAPIPMNAAIVWAKDGSRIFVVESTGESDSGHDSDNQGRRRPAFEPQTLIAVGLDGEIRQLAQSDGEREFYLVSAAPDGSSVVYWSVDETRMLPSVSYWRVGIDGGAPEQLSDPVSEAYSGPGVTWYADGDAVLVGEVTVPYLEQHDVVWSRGNAATTEIVAVDEAGRRTTLLASFSVGDRLLGWIEDDAMPGGTAEHAGEDVTYTDPVPVDNVPDGTQLGRGSAASLDGRYLTLEDTAIGSPLVWTTGSDDTQRLRGSLEDSIWLPGTNGLLTVSAPRGSTRSASHLSVLTPTNPYAPEVLEPRPFDPVTLEIADGNYYAQPRVSPDGLNTSFFVVDATNGRVELWMANELSGVAPITGWSLPADRLFEPSLVSCWVDDRTLVFAEPRGWSRGMPGSVAIQRITIGDDGQPTLDNLIELSGRGNDRGVVLTELAINATGTDLAWRIRHYTKQTANDGRFDTIHVAPADDVTDDLELTRGSPGSGLAWAADGRRLLIGIDSEVEVADAGNLDVVVISGDERAAFPIWVGEDEIWFSAGDDHRLMRVQVMNGE